MDNLSPISHPCTSSSSYFGNHTVATVLSRNVANAFMSARPLALASAYTFLTRLSFSGETGNRITRSSIPLNHTSSRNTQSNLSEWPSFRRKSRKSATALSNSGKSSSISTVLLEPFYLGLLDVFGWSPGREFAGVVLASVLDDKCRPYLR